MGAQPDGRLDPRTSLHGPAYDGVLWSTTVRIVTDDPPALPSARRLVDGELARVERAVSRVRRDSEVETLTAGRRTCVSPTLAAILAAARQAARVTDGRLDPILGHPLEATGADHTGATDEPWHGIELDEEARTVLVPRGVRLDLVSIAQAWAADRCAEVVADGLGVGVLVSLGGDLATAGPAGSAGSGAWEILVQDRPAGPAALIAVPTGLAVATSTAQQGRWRCATVVAPDCVTAHTWSAAVLAGPGQGVPADCGHPARLVDADRTVYVWGGWPLDAEVRPVPASVSAPLSTPVSAGGV